MKNLFKIRTFAMLALIATFIVSCNNDDEAVVTPAPVVDNTITGKAVATADLSILVAALTKTNLAATLQGAGPFTVFAPTNLAFSNAGISVASINSSTQAQLDVLKQVLLNHVVSGSFQSTNLTDGTYIKTLGKGAASTSNTLSMFVAKTAAGAVKLNGVSNVATANVMASNGIIHIVDAVISLPTIATHAVANPSFNTLEAIVTNPAQSAVLADLSGTTILTVFAPTDAAFTAFNTELTTTANPNGLAGVSSANVTKVLQYHVVAGNNLAANLAAGSLNTVLGQSFGLALTPTVRITDINGRVSNVTPADVQCSNGVIHVLDKVLLPTL